VRRNIVDSLGNGSSQDEAGRASPRLRYVAAMRLALDRWFADEILVHEEALLRYLRQACPNLEEAHDLRQDIYTRVYEAAICWPTAPGARRWCRSSRWVISSLRSS
jgi:RNA polymerase sigma-70 factor (ECF subfamily)